MIVVGHRSQGPRDVDVGEALSVPQKREAFTFGLDVVAHDLAAVVEAGRRVPDGVRVIDCPEIPAFLAYVTVLDEVVGAGQLAAIVEVEDLCAAGCSGNIKRGGQALLIAQEPVFRPIKARVEACDLAAVVDGGREHARPSRRVRDLDRREGTLGISHEAADHPRGGGDADDPAAVVDVVRDGGRAARRIDRGESTVVQQEPVRLPRSIDVLAHDLATVVDAEGLGPHGARDIDFGENSFVEQETTW